MAVTIVSLQPDTRCNGIVRAHAQEALKQFLLTVVCVWFCVSPALSLSLSVSLSVSLSLFLCFLVSSFSCFFVFLFLCFFCLFVGLLVS